MTHPLRVTPAAVAYACAQTGRRLIPGRWLTDDDTPRPGACALGNIALCAISPHQPQPTREHLADYANMLYGEDYVRAFVTAFDQLPSVPTERTPRECTAVEDAVAIRHEMSPGGRLHHWT